MEPFEKEFENILLPWMGRTMKLVDHHIACRLKVRDILLTKAQLILLRRLKEFNGCPQNNLAFVTNRDTASLARLITTMEKKNLVARIPSEEDQRVNHIYITKAGDLAFRKAWPVMKEILRELQQGLSDSEVDQTIGIMRKILTQLESNEWKKPKTQSI